MPSDAPVPPFSPRLECARCGRPESVCYCAHLVSLPTRTRVLVLQHPREADNAVGTARIAKLCLPNAELAVGVALGQHSAVRAALSDPARPAIVLYPSPGAHDLATEPPTGPVTLVVIDGTWAHARTLVRENPWLSDLPRYAFRPGRPSEYQIRREPLPEYVSTIEALAEALSLLEADGRTFEELRQPFRAMVAMQVAYAERSTGARRRVRRREESEARARLPSELLSPDLVCMAGEANAWPHDPELGRPPHPHELVQLLLSRVHGAEAHGAALGQNPPPGTGFCELFLRPKAPLSTSPVIHAQLSWEQLAQGVAFDEARVEAEAFMGEDSVLCTWGPYAAGLFARDGGRLPRRTVDVRKVVGDITRGRAGSLEATVQRLSLAHAPAGAGRGGKRLGMLIALTRWLAVQAAA